MKRRGFLKALGAVAAGLGLAQIPHTNAGGVKEIGKAGVDKTPLPTEEALDLPRFDIPKEWTYGTDTTRSVCLTTSAPMNHSPLEECAFIGHHYRLDSYRCINCGTERAR